MYWMFVAWKSVSVFNGFVRFLGWVLSWNAWVDASISRWKDPWEDGWGKTIVIHVMDKQIR
jgi:hypothetical protein